jgi:transcriptional regulator with XRE-family HTH domain
MACQLIDKKFAFTKIIFTFVMLTLTKMNERIQQFLAAENISQAQLADTLGVSRASISHIVSGRNKPSADFIVSMMNRFPSLNVEWLLTGTGKMYKTRQEDFERQKEEKPEEISLFSDQGSEVPAESPRGGGNPVQMKAPEPIPQTSEGKDTRSVIQESADNQRHITKITVFFDDNTFLEIT